MLVKIQDAQVKGQYIPTIIDDNKASADFRLVDMGYIIWKDGKGEKVTKRQLKKLQNLHTWVTDF